MSESSNKQIEEFRNLGIEELRDLGIEELKNLKTQHLKRATLGLESLFLYPMLYAPCPMLYTLNLEP